MVVQGGVSELGQVADLPWPLGVLGMVLKETESIGYKSMSVLEEINTYNVINIYTHIYIIKRIMRNCLT